MSTEEADLILGRATRRTKDTLNTMALLRSKLAAQWRSLRDASNALESFRFGDALKPETMESIIGKMSSGYPSYAEILVTLQELKQAEADAREAKSELEAIMG